MGSSKKTEDKVKYKVLQWFLGNDPHAYWNTAYIADQLGVSRSAVRNAVGALGGVYGGVRQIRSSSDGRKRLVNIPLEYYPKESGGPLTVERAREFLHKMRKAQEER